MDLTTYRDFQITVSEGGIFEAVVDNEPNPISGDTLRALKENLDQYLNRQAKTRKLALPVLLHNGERAMATGIHLRTGAVTGLPERTSDFYPAVDWIAATIEHIQLLSAEIRRLQNQIYPYTIRSSRHGSGGRSPLVNVYVEAIEKLEAEYAQKKAAALADPHVEEAC